jgi:flagellar basal-body rod modification protein FlgD
MSVSTSAVSSTTTQPDQSTSRAVSYLGKDDFLKLLTAQLANQDPLQPVDNQAFIAQLAQFSSLEQMQNVSTRIDELAQAMTSSSRLTTASLVGRTASYQTSDIDLVSGATPALQADLSAAGKVAAVIRNAAGSVVRTLDAGSHEAGLFDVGWDGKDQQGNALPAGRYSVALSATSADGASVAVKPVSHGTVKGVSLSGDEAQLMIGSSRVSMSDVVKITQP